MIAFRCILKMELDPMTITDEEGRFELGLCAIPVQRNLLQ